MIHHNLDLFYGICNTITENNRRQTHFLLLIANYFDICFKWINKFFYNIICFNASHDFYVIIFWMHYTLFSVSLSPLVEDIKLSVTNNWIFHVWNCLRSFTLSLKYGLILSRYSSTDSVLYFYHSYFYSQYNHYSKSYLLLMAHNNCLLLFILKKILNFSKCYVFNFFNSVF